MLNTEAHNARLAEALGVLEAEIKEKVGACVIARRAGSSPRARVGGRRMQSASRRRVRCANALAT